ERDPGRRPPSAGRLLADLAALAGRRLAPEELGVGEGSVLSSRLVGREAALGELRAALERAERGEGGALVVEGPEGIGKSRLLREFRLLAALGGARVAMARAAAHRSQPLAALLSCLGQLGLAPAAAAPAGAAEGECVERYALFRGIAAALAGAAERDGALLLLLDDLHLAGRESAEAVAFLARELAAARCLLVAARHPSPGEIGDEDPLAAAPEVRTLPLPPLARGETGELVAACLGAEQPPAGLVDGIQAQSAGVPARVGPLLRHLVEERVLRFRAGEWKPSVAGLGRLAVRPGGAEGLAREQVAALPAGEREALEAVAAIGEPGDLELVAAALGRGAEEVYPALERLCGRGLVERLEEAGGPLYAPAQARLAEALYEGLEEARRRQLHLAAGEALERRAEAGGPELSGEIAEHLWRAGERLRSLPHLLAAGRAASAVHGHSDAATRFGRAVAAATEGGDLEAALAARVAPADALAAAGQAARAVRILEELLGPEGAPLRRAGDRELAAGLHLRAGRLHGRLGDHEAALAAFSTGLALLAGLERPELEIDLLHGQAGALREAGRPEEGFAAARSALARAARLGLHRQRAALLNTLGMGFYARGDWRRAGRVMRRGLSAAAETGDERLAVKLRNNLGNVLWKTGDLAGARALYRDNLAFCERVRDPWGQLSALNNLGILECSQGEWKHARESLGRSFELARRLRAREAETLARLNLADIEEMLGDWPRARRLNEQVLRLLAETPDHANRLSALLQLGSLARRRGDHEEARALVEEARAGAERIGDGDLHTLCHLQLGTVALERERFAEAAEQLGAARARAAASGTREIEARAALKLAELALRRGERERAVELAAASRRSLERLGDRGALAEQLLLEGRLAEGEEAERQFAAGVEELRELELPFEFARGLYDWGVRTAAPALALERLDRALVAFDRLGAMAEAERTRGAMELVRQRQRLESGRRGAPGLYEVAKLINSSLDQQEVLDRTMDIVLARLNAERGMVVLWNALTHEL
ncbi:MAG: tetratricopeptide repeat protein, partial [Thermoanaerobaculia bacterium]|nr:tetratricopeptide repeat protein [Thermoanaerobaculia bacterium]